MGLRSAYLEKVRTKEKKKQKTRQGKYGHEQVFQPETRGKNHLYGTRDDNEGRR